MTSITLYGGVGEVGGNKILVSEGKNSFFLDFGMSFKAMGMYFDEFMKPRKLNGMGDLLEMGILPELRGIYRQDYLRRMQREPEKKPAVEGVFLSHAHADHVAHITYLRPDIPIYGTLPTCRIMQALSETGAAFSELMVMKEAFRFRPKKTNPLEYTKMKGVEVEVGRKVKELEGPVQIGKMKIEAVPVNHSLPGACGYIVETPSGTVVYTGDLRFHGYGGHLTEAFVKKAAEAEPKLLISEGTRIDSDGGLTEEEVKGEILGHMEGCKKLVLANWPVRDTDRLRTFYEVAKKSGRKLAICTKQAYILKMLYDAKVGTPSPKDKHIAVYMRRKGWGTLGEEGWPENIMLADYADWEKEFLDYENMVTYKDVKESQEEYLLRCDFFELAELIDLKPDKGSVYIRSVVEPFNEEMELDEKRVKNWLAHFGLLPYKQTHCSGHARGPELKRMIEAIAPEMLMPVHTEKPEKFKGLAEKVVIPKKGRKYEI